MMCWTIFYDLKGMEVDKRTCAWLDSHYSFHLLDSSALRSVRFPNECSKVKITFVLIENRICAWVASLLFASPTIQINFSTKTTMSSECVGVDVLPEQHSIAKLNEIISRTNCLCIFLIYFLIYIFNDLFLIFASHSLSAIHHTTLCKIYETICFVCTQSSSSPRPHRNISSTALQPFSLVYQIEIIYFKIRLNWKKQNFLKINRYSETFQIEIEISDVYEIE